MYNEFDTKFENVSKLFQNLDLIGNARIYSVMYDLAPAQTGRRGRPAKHGKHLSVETDFTFSNEKIGDYYTGVRRVLAKIFGNREVLAYVTATEKEHGTKRLFFSTIFPEDLQIFCAWQEKAPLNQTGSDRMKYIPLLLYSLRWNIETSYYEQKTFWSFCNYMVRSCKGIEMLVNLINISYCAMKILPYQKNNWTSIFRQISPSFNHYSSHQILIQAQILAHCSHKLKNAVQSSQIVLHFLNTGGFFIFCYNLM